MSDLKKLKRAEQKALRPAQILDAAFEEFVKTGYAATRIEEIAERIGVTRGTIYVYFGTKELLFEAMIEHISSPFAEFRRALQDLSGSPKTKLLKLLSLAYDYIEDRRVRESFRFVIAEGLRFPDIVDRHHNQFVAPIVTAVRAILEEGAESGEFREQPAQYSELAIAPLITTIILQLIFDGRKSLDRESFIKAHLDLLMCGLLKRPTSLSVN